MSRGATGETITVRPSNNVYTALAVVTVLAQVISLVILYMRASADGLDLLK